MSIPEQYTNVPEQYGGFQNMLQLALLDGQKNNSHTSNLEVFPVYLRMTEPLWIVTDDSPFWSCLAFVDKTTPSFPGRVLGP